ncbi:MAG: 40S ribosomal protein S19, partial [Candidatus Hermodarchaeota archaeon]
YYIKDISMSIYVVEPGTLIHAIAEKLKEYPEIKPPEGSEFWKTAFFKELAPIDSENFWYIRCSSLLRKINKYGSIGVNKLRKYYGGKNRKGAGLNHSAKGSGKIIRVALQQLERANLIERSEKEGRKLTAEGLSLLERTAYSILRKK